VTCVLEPFDRLRDGRRHEIERHDLRVRVLDRRPRGSAVVDHHLHEGPAGGEMMTGAISEDGEHFGRLMRVELRK
jgi:hypothetical protein